MLEVNDLFSGWKDYPPTNILVKALVEGFGGGIKSEPEANFDMPSEAFEAMQQSAIQGIAARAGPRIPVIVGRDEGLPKTPPTFDLTELRRRNNEIKAKNAMKGVKHVGV